ncbi:YnhF family membrane protein [Vibrio makurazakiensis]
MEHDLKNALQIVVCIFAVILTFGFVAITS